MICFSCRAAQELEDKRPEPLRVAITLVGGSMAAEYPLVVVMEEALPLEGLMDHQLGGSPLELREDRMAVQPQGAPMVSHLQIPMVPSILGLMDRDLL